MAKQVTKVWIVIASLCMFVMVAACTPIVGADGSVSTGKPDTVHIAPQEGDGSAVGETGGDGVNVTVDEIELRIMESFPIQVAVMVRGNLPDGCSVLDGISATRDGNAFTLDIAAHKEDGMCTMALVPFEEQVALNVQGLKAGTYRVVAGDISTEFTFDVDNGDSGTVEVRPLPLGNESDGLVTGEIVMRDATGTTELPKGTTVTVSLADISRQDVRAVLLGEQVYEAEQLPMSYELPYDTGAINEKMTYAVSARVHDAAGRLLCLTDTAHHALTRGAGESVTVELVAVK